MPTLACTSSDTPASMKGSAIFSRIRSASAERGDLVDRGPRHDPELVTAEPRDRSLLAEQRFQAPSEFLEEEVAARVTERVVDLLEAVEVEQHDGDAARLALGDPRPTARCGDGTELGSGGR